MKKKFTVFITAILSLVFILSGCGTNEDSDSNTETQDVEAQGNTTEDRPSIKWGKSMTGVPILSIAKEKGIFDKYNIEIEEYPIEGHSDAISGLKAGNINLITNSGTNEPLAEIAAGEELTIVGGNMAIGGMSIIGPEGSELNSIEDLVGKRVAEKPSAYELTGPLLEAGYDPLEDVEWVEYPSYSDKIAGVLNGDVDYAVMNTTSLYTVQNTPGIEIVSWKDELTPQYSCCRLVMPTSFVEDNRDLIKDFLKALMEAHAIYVDNPEEAIRITAEDIGAEEEMVAAFINSEHYDNHPDPLADPVYRAWDILDETGFLSENARNINIEDHMANDIYVEALNEYVEENEEENPEHTNGLIEYYEAWNTSELE